MFSFHSFITVDGKDDIPEVSRNIKTENICQRRDEGRELAFAFV